MRWVMWSGMVGTGVLALCCEVRCDEISYPTRERKDGEKGRKREGWEEKGTYVVLQVAPFQPTGHEPHDVGRGRDLVGANDVSRSSGAGSLRFLLDGEFRAEAVQFSMLPFDHRHVFFKQGRFLGQYVVDVVDGQVLPIDFVEDVVQVLALCLKTRRRLVDDVAFAGWADVLEWLPKGEDHFVCAFAT